ncbi:MAG TPA: hypothetical protein VF816_10050 [Rhodocyclaceae bacterium]
MKDIDWKAISRQELASLLVETRRVSSHAVGATTLYRLERNGREILAMALPDGYALILEKAAQAKWRRRIDLERDAQRND